MPTLLDRLKAALADRYAIDSEIGRGGMATVFLASDLKHSRRVAIKVLRPELATAVGAERFIREIETAALLSHPHILTLIDSGEVEGFLYYVMPYVDGESLREHLRRAGTLPLDESLRIGREVADALGYAHRMGIAHRDIKPENILVYEGHAVVADFGIATAIRAAGGAALTATGVALGSPLYMSPEQVLGQAVDERSDIYSLACVIFEMLTGGRPHEGSEFMTVARRRFTEPAPRLTSLRSDLPAELDDAIARALEPDPEERIQSIDELREALVATPGERGASAERSGVTRGRLAILVALVAVALSLMVFDRTRTGDAPSASAEADLALLPCESVLPGAGADTLVESLGLLAARMLRDLPQPRLVDPKRSASWWRSQSPADRSVAAAATALRTAAVVECTATRGGDSIEIALRLYDRDGVLQPSPPVIRGAASFPPSQLAREMALSLIEKVKPGIVLSGSSGWSALENHDEEAVRAFLIGELAFTRDEWDAAVRYFANALEHDSTFTLARWRLAEAERWAIGMETSVDLDRLYREHGSELGVVDRRLLEAAIAPRGPEQLEAYERLIEDDPNDAYPALLFADELFHRGALFGIGADSVLAALQRAAALDSSLAPSYDHLARLQIRLGQEAQARESLDHLSKIAGDDRLTRLLEFAFAERFSPEVATVIRDEHFAPVGENMPVLMLVARYVLSFGLPEAQHDYGRRLVAVAGTHRAGRASGHLAQGVALLSMGRLQEALPHFDSAAAARGGAEGRLQAAQWRVVPYALGLEGTPEHEIARGREALEAIGNDESMDPGTRTRAAWSLAMLASRDGNNGAAARWTAELETGSRAVADSTLSLFAEAVLVAQGGDPVRALELSYRLSAYDSTTIEARPFQRAAVHLMRGAWMSEIGRMSDADAEWVWYENLDLEGTPDLLLQAADVDWALGTYGRVRRAGLARQMGDARRACALATEALRYLSDPEPSADWLVLEASTVRDASC